MFYQLIFLVALLGFGQPQNQCVREIQSLRNELQVELRDVKETIKSTNHSVSREDVQELVEDKATKKDVLIIKDELTAGTDVMIGALDANQNSTLEGFHKLVRDKATKEDVKALQKKVTKGNELMTDTLLADQSAKRDELVELLSDIATKKDVRKRANEVIQTLNFSVATGNEHIMETLLQILESQDGIKNATTLKLNNGTDIPADRCMSREEVDQVIQSKVESVVRTEVQSLTQLVANNTALLQELHALSRHPLGSFQNPVISQCKNIPQGSPSGYYWIQPSGAPAARQYCDMDRTCCDSRGGWMRVANLDMTDPNQQCPSELKYMSSPRRSCRVLTTGCTSVTYTVHGVEYSRVCGRVIGYQKGSVDAFNGGRRAIDSTYVDGVSLTHGFSPRKHIWTFAAAIDETRSNVLTCPCTRPDLSHTPTVPEFIGNDYFCETGSRNHYVSSRFYHEDPLWDGQGCGARSICCGFNNPPWFCKHLPQPTTDNIELRLCKDESYGNEDITLEEIELYVQ